MVKRPMPYSVLVVLPWKSRGREAHIAWLDPLTGAPSRFRLVTDFKVNL